MEDNASMRVNRPRHHTYWFIDVLADLIEVVWKWAKERKRRAQKKKAPS